jgi:hypothetical protein
MRPFPKSTQPGTGSSALQRDIDTAIDYTPIDRSLDTPAKRYALREMVKQDCAHFDETVEKAFFKTGHRTRHLRAVITLANATRQPLFAVIASKASSSSTTLQVHVLQGNLKLSRAQKARMIWSCLFAVRVFGTLSNATRVRVPSIGQNNREFFEGLGFRIELKRRLLHAVSELAGAPAPSTKH